MVETKEQQSTQLSKREPSSGFSFMTPFWNPMMKDFFEDPLFRDPWLNIRPFRNEMGIQQNMPTLSFRSDISETDKEIKIICDAPGLKKEDINIDVDDDTRMLTISGESSMENKEDNETYHIMERRSGKFKRTFQLPENVRLEAVRAKLDDGILRVSVPKLGEKRQATKTINIE